MELVKIFCGSPEDIVCDETRVFGRRVGFGLGTPLLYDEDWKVDAGKD